MFNLVLVVVGLILIGYAIAAIGVLPALLMAVSGAMIWIGFILIMTWIMRRT